MNKSRAFCVLVFVIMTGSISETYAQKQDISSEMTHLPWMHGPYNLRLQGGATFKIPKGYAALSSPNSNRFLELQGNPAPEEQVYIIEPEAENKDWFAVLNYRDEGHISDNEHIDADLLLKDIRDSEVEDNKERKAQHMPTLNVLGWQLPPNYNQKTHRLEWSFRFGNGDDIVDNLNTRFLTRTGFYKAIIVTSDKSFFSDVDDFNHIAPYLEIDTGNRYNDYQDGDKLARYGLMGLVGGGAAAVAVKYGLIGGILAFLTKIFGTFASKGFFAVIIGGVVVGFKKIKSLFMRK